MKVDGISLYTNQNNVDLQKVARYLNSLPYTFQDSEQKNVFLICGSKTAKNYCSIKTQELRKRLGAGNYPYSCCVVHLYPQGVGIGMGLYREHQTNEIKKFINWLVEQYNFTITDDYGVEWTETIKKEGIDILFAQENKAKKPVSLKKRLIWAFVFGACVVFGIFAVIKLAGFLAVIFGIIRGHEQAQSLNIGYLLVDIFGSLVVYSLITYILIKAGKYLTKSD